MDDVNVTGDCGINKTEAKLVISWPKKSFFYQMVMKFGKVEAATASNDMTSWIVHIFTFKVTLENNTDFKNASGKCAFVLYSAFQFFLLFVLRLFLKN